MEKALSLYSGKNCHLCDMAENLIRQTLVTVDEDMTKVDISDDHQLYHLYGARIPVLMRHDTGTELAWPFDQKQLVEFLS